MGKNGCEESDFLFSLLFSFLPFAYHLFPILSLVFSLPFTPFFSILFFLCSFPFHFVSFSPYTLSSFFFLFPFLSLFPFSAMPYLPFLLFLSPKPSIFLPLPLPLPSVSPHSFLCFSPPLPPHCIPIFFFLPSLHSIPPLLLLLSPYFPFLLPPLNPFLFFSTFLLPLRHRLFFPPTLAAPLNTYMDEGVIGCKSRSDNPGKVLQLPQCHKRCGDVLTAPRMLGNED